MLSAKLSTLIERPDFACAGPETEWPADRDTVFLKDAVADHFSWQSGCMTCIREGKAARERMPSSDRDYLCLCFRAIRMRAPDMRVADAIIEHRSRNPYIRAMFAMLGDKYLDPDDERKIMALSFSILSYERALMHAAIARIWNHFKDVIPDDAVPPHYRVA
jgi:hypothetical protein